MFFMTNNLDLEIGVLGWQAFPIIPHVAEPPEISNRILFFIITPVTS